MTTFNRKKKKKPCIAYIYVQCDCQGNKNKKIYHGILQSPVYRQCKNGECKALVISFEILIKPRINFTPESDLGVVCFSNFLLKVTCFQISDYLFFLLLVNLLLIS